MRANLVGTGADSGSGGSGIGGNGTGGGGNGIGGGGGKMNIFLLPPSALSAF